MGDRPFRLLPALDDDNTPFWTGGESGRLVFPKCGDCSYLVHPPSPVCPRCLSRNLSHTAVATTGTVHSFTVNEQAWNPTMPPPYVVALVELDAQPGLRLMTNIVGCPVDDVAIGMAVEAVFEQHEDVWVPLFTPRRATDA